MKIISGDEVRAATPWRDLTAALRAGFAGGEITAPARHHHTLPIAHEDPATLLLMPAWDRRHIGSKILTIHPGNRARDMHAVHSQYYLMETATGTPLALIDGGEVTARRTAAASVLAAGYLADPEAKNLLIVGAGRIACNLLDCYQAHYHFDRISVSTRNPEKARTFANGVEAVTNLKQAAAEADIITCATLSTEPIIKGAWLKPGAHLDLVGGYRPDMREADNAAVANARLYVDTYEGALSEAGDLIQPMEAGLIKKDDIRGDLATLCRDDKPLFDPAVRSLFKSVGAAIEDFIAASIVYERLDQSKQAR